MTTATIVNDQMTSAPAMWGTDTRSQQEESFNIYWAGVYEQMKEPEGNTVIQIKEEDIIKLVHSLYLFAPGHEISQENLRLIKFLDQWMSESDDLGEQFWKEFCEDIEKNRFTI